MELVFSNGLIGPDHAGFMDGVFVGAMLGMLSMWLLLSGAEWVGAIIKRIRGRIEVE